MTSAKPCCECAWQNALLCTCQDWDVSAHLPSTSSAASPFQRWAMLQILMTILPTKPSPSLSPSFHGQRHT